MSALRPTSKQPRLQGQTAVKRTESVELSTRVTSVGSAPRTVSSQDPVTTSQDPTKKTENHPRGHKVKELSDVWKTMDQQTYLRLTDTLLLGDVWVQPKSILDDGQVVFVEVVFAPNIKFREVTKKISSEDLLQMLYLNDSIQADMDGVPRLEFDVWVSEKTREMIKAHGVDDATNKAKLANFILSEDETFSFYPSCCHNTVSMFFRKTCYHSYKHPDNKTNPKIKNPCMVKCPTRGKFEYIIEARPMVIPYEWREPPASAHETEDHPMN